MMTETQEIIHRDLNFLPLKSYANIFEGNALRIDWTKILPNDINFIMGNPSFVGRRYRTREQVTDISKFFTYKDVDYVACWYKKAADFLNFYDTKSPEKSISVIQKVAENSFGIYQNSEKKLSVYTKIQCAFVSTNSITQGEQVAAIWENLPEINFAYRTFRWDSESNDKAHVHCVIIGFANFSREQKIIFDGDRKIFAKNINFYLMDAPNIFIKNRSKTLQKNIPQMCNGNMAANLNFSLTEEEKNILEKNFPDAKKFIKNLVGGEEFLHNKKRFCLCLVGANPSEIKKIPPIYERIKKVREFRLNSKSFEKIADRPHEFRDLKNPKNFIVIPQVSSENREYIPMAFLNENFIPTTQVQIIPDANLFLFGILESSIHMIWTKNFCGRLESRYRYSKDIVYNNFIWCEPSEKNIKKISATAQNILDCRKNYPNSSLADLYDPILMPKDLRDAHKKMIWRFLRLTVLKKIFRTKKF